MITINLLPWRETLRLKRRRKIRLICTGILIMFFVLLLLVRLYLDRALNNVEAQWINLGSVLKELNRENEERNLGRVKEEAIFHQLENQHLLRQEFSCERHWLSELAAKLPAQCCIEKVRVHSEGWLMVVECKRGYIMSSLISSINSLSGLREAGVHRLEPDEKNGMDRIEFNGRRLCGERNRRSKRNA